MTIVPLLLLAASRLCAEDPVSLRVGIEAPADTGYEIRSPEGRKLGRTGDMDGFSPEDRVEVAGGAPSRVSLSFYDEQGLVAACPAVEVRFSDAEPLCEPRFALSKDRKARPVCESSCRPTRTDRRRKMERGWFSATPGY